MQQELCERIAHTLESAPIHDHLGYDALAYLKLWGPDYLQVLKAMHGALQPKLYVEIGVRRGASLMQALPETKVIGIDPNMNFSAPIEREHNMLLSSATSDEFFGLDVNREKCRGFDLAFIDGDHSFEQALRDFENLESLARASSIICLHDVIPMDERTAQPKPLTQRSFHTGEVWRLMASLVASRKDLQAFTVAAPLTGLGIVGGFGRYATPCGIPKWEGGFPSSWDEQVRILNIVPNDVLATFGVGSAK